MKVRGRLAALVFHLAICMTHHRRGPYWVVAIVITMLMWIAQSGSSWAGGN
jgi:hypothetical protein